jgi:hypothetical protein
MRLWRNDEGTARLNKFLVLRRDGTLPEWPYFVLGARDPAAPAALRIYAHEARRCGLDEAYVEDVFALADEFQAYHEARGPGDPDAAPHRPDDPTVLAALRDGTPPLDAARSALVTALETGTSSLGLVDLEALVPLMRLLGVPTGRLGAPGDDHPDGAPRG